MTTGRTTDTSTTRPASRPASRPATDQQPAECRTGWAELLRTPGARRGGVALLVLLAIYLVGALSHLHVLGL